MDRNEQKTIWGLRISYTSVEPEIKSVKERCIRVADITIVIQVDSKNASICIELSKKLSPGQAVEN